MYNPPPADLPSRAPLIHVSTETDIWYRSHSMDKGPLFFGKTMTQRWDAPAGEFGVLYLGSDEFCAFMESIGRSVLRTRLVPRTLVQQNGVSRVRFTKSLRLIDLVSSGGLARIGAEGSLSSGSGYKNSQRWSKALRDHPEKPDGIYYAPATIPVGRRVLCTIIALRRSRLLGRHGAGTTIRYFWEGYWITTTWVLGEQGRSNPHAQAV
jgi:RES domain